MDSIDKLLAEIQAEYAEVKTQLQQPQLPTAKPFIASSHKSNSLMDNLLAEVKADLLERDAAEDLRKQQELEQLKAKQLEILQKQAQEWLSKLDPFSPEGMWFEHFAEAYSSKLEAAIEYLQNNA